MWGACSRSGDGVGETGALTRWTPERDLRGSSDSGGALADPLDRGDPRRTNAGLASARDGLSGTATTA
jgi:hypothetical protein